MENTTSETSSLSTGDRKGVDRRKPVARPILFSAPMVRALIEGRKTQTRRILKTTKRDAECLVWLDYPEGREFYNGCADGSHVWPDGNEYPISIPYGVPGDLLWVRETWANTWDMFDSDDPPPSWLKTSYRADHPEISSGWKPSIHMPRARSRLTLEITHVRVERLQDISEADAKAEGAMYHDGHGIGHSGWRHDFKDVHANCRSAYARLWNEINGPGSWDANPLVVALTFTVHTQDVDAVLSARAAKLEPAA